MAANVQVECSRTGCACRASTTATNKRGVFVKAYRFERQFLVPEGWHSWPPWMDTLPPCFFPAATLNALGLKGAGSSDLPVLLRARAFCSVECKAKMLASDAYKALQTQFDDAGDDFIRGPRNWQDGVSDH